ncbi:MAG TPA: hypothetical protein VJ717_04335 [Gemmatimonadaceae bacterium]|nr:hypothetical protein [Gemmatimonadaceae bacterium]
MRLHHVLGSIIFAVPVFGTAIEGQQTRSRRDSSAQCDSPCPRKSPNDSAVRRRSAPEWPVKGPAPLPGSILPNKRILAYYGNPLSKRMGILGEVPPNEMLDRLDKEVARWAKADTTTPIVPALHLIVTVAQAHPGKDGKYRARMDSSLIERVYGWAQRHNALMFLDVQVGLSTVRAELPWLEKYLSRPNVHLALDPEFAMKTGKRPGTVIGSMNEDDINYATGFLSGVVQKYQLPPKVLVIHRFTQNMLRNYKQIRLDPRVQIVINMDGWGNPSLKRGSYERYVYQEPIQFTGFKLFYKNDRRKPGWRLMTPEEVLALNPRPVYIQYQ